MTWSTRAAAAACVTLLGAAMWVRYSPAHASEAGAGKPVSAVVHCQEALVNPVSGNAECVRPPGAPVDPPPPRPQPTNAACRKHRALGLKECRRPRLQDSKRLPTDAATPPK